MRCRSWTVRRLNSTRTKKGVTYTSSFTPSGREVTTKRWRWHTSSLQRKFIHQRGLSRRRLVHPVDQQNQLSHPERLQQDLATTSDGSFEKVCRMKYSTRWIDSVVRYRRNNRAICLKCGRGGSCRRLGVLDAEVNGPIFRREKSTRYCVLQLRVLSLQLRSILLCICLVRFHAPEVRNTVIDFI